MELRGESGLAALRTSLGRLRVVTGGVIEVGLLGDVGAGTVARDGLIARLAHIGERLGSVAGIQRGEAVTAGDLVPGRIDGAVIVLSHGITGDAASLATGVNVDPVVAQVITGSLELLVALLVAEIAALLELLVLAFLVGQLELNLRVAVLAELGVHLRAVHLVDALPTLVALVRESVSDVLGHDDRSFR